MATLQANLNSSIFGLHFRSWQTPLYMDLGDPSKIVELKENKFRTITNHFAKKAEEQMIAPQPSIKLARLLDDRLD